MASLEPAHDLQKVLPVAEMPCNETSPDSKCPICLDRFSNVSYADKCLHRFCFLCILEWGKNKAECPLCKQPISSVYHSVRSEDDFKLYELRPVENGSFGNVRGQRFRYRTTQTHGLRRERQARRSSRNQDLMRFRRWLYRHGVRVQGVQDGGRSRDTSAEFFRKNPACLHRLVPWLKRELAVLYGSHDSVADVVLHVILSLITRQNMQDEAFLRELRPFLLSRTEHFLHEFLSFTKSPFNMEAYDLRAVYSCHAPFQLSAVSEAGSGLSSAPSPWDDETPGPSYSSTTQSVFTVTISDSDVDSASEDEEETVRVNANTNANINVNHAQVDEDDHSSDGDCVIVGFIKPTAQRTPELVQLSSDSETSVQEDKKTSTSKQLDVRDLTNQRHRNTVVVPSHSATVQSSKSKHRDYSSHSHRQHSRSYKDRRGHKEASHRSRSRTHSHRHHRHTDIYYSQDTPHQSRARSQSKTPSQSHLFSRTSARTCSRSRSPARLASGSRARSRFRSRECWRPGSRERSQSRSRERLQSGSREHWRSRSRECWRPRSRKLSRPRSFERSQSRSHEHSHYRTHANSWTRTHVRSYSRNQRMQTSPKNRKRSKGPTVSPAPSSTWRSSCDKWHGKSKHKSPNGEKRKRRSRERHQHHPKKTRRRSSSMEDIAERRKHHKKKKKHKKERRNRKERMGQNSRPSSSTAIAILSDTQSAEGATHPRSAAPTNTKILNFSHGAATCANTAHQTGTTSNCVKDKTLLSKSPRVSTSSRFPENILPFHNPPQTCRASSHHSSNADSPHHAPSNTDSLQNASPSTNSSRHASSNSDSLCRTLSKSDSPNYTSFNFDSPYHDSSNSSYSAPSNTDSLHNSSPNASSTHHASSTSDSPHHTSSNSDCLQHTFCGSEPPRHGSPNAESPRHTSASPQCSKAANLF